MSSVGATAFKTGGFRLSNVEYLPNFLQLQLPLEVLIQTIVIEQMDIVKQLLLEQAKGREMMMDLIDHMERSDTLRVRLVLEVTKE